MAINTKTIGELLEYGQTLFETNLIYFGHGTDNAWDEAVYLLSHVLDLPPNADRSLLDNAVSKDDQEKIKALYQQRIDKRIPAPYITQQAWFCTLPFYVDERVIIPRSPLPNLFTISFNPGALKHQRRFSTFVPAVAVSVLPAPTPFKRLKWC